jgi:DNA-binding NarL/FixJ family response regulator
MSDYNIVIADDHEIVRRGIRSAIEELPGCHVVGEAADGEAALELVRTNRPALAVLDVTMPRMNGFETAAAIREVSPDTAVLVLTMHESNQVVREVLRAGAKGYLLKSDAGRELAEAVQAIRQGRTYFTQRVTSMVVDEFVGERAAAPPETPNLSPREREIVRLLALGRSNKEVASGLGLSVKTVESHRTNVMRKLGVHSVAGLVRFAVREGLVEA